MGVCALEGSLLGAVGLPLDQPGAAESPPETGCTVLWQRPEHFYFPGTVSLLRLHDRAISYAC